MKGRAGVRVAEMGLVEKGAVAAFEVEWAAEEEEMEVGVEVLAVEKAVEMGVAAKG